MVAAAAVANSWIIPAVLETVARNRATSNGRPVSEGVERWGAAGRFLLDLADRIRLMIIGLRRIPAGDPDQLRD